MIGTVKEVQPEGGLLKGEDGRDYVFSLDVCFIFGVCLRQIPSSQVLAPGMYFGSSCRVVTGGMLARWGMASSFGSDIFELCILWGACDMRKKCLLTPQITVLRGRVYKPWEWYIGVRWFESPELLYDIKKEHLVLNPRNSKHVVSWTQCENWCNLHWNMSCESLLSQLILFLKLLYRGKTPPNNSYKLLHLLLLCPFFFCSSLFCPVSLCKSLSVSLFFHPLYWSAHELPSYACIFFCLWLTPHISPSSMQTSFILVNLTIITASLSLFTSQPTNHLSLYFQSFSSFLLYPKLHIKRVNHYINSSVYKKLFIFKAFHIIFPFI